MHTKPSDPPMVRIRVEAITDYAWPFIAILEQRDGRDSDWYEIDAEGGDSPSEAIATLRVENRQAARTLLIQSEVR